LRHYAYGLIVLPGEGMAWQGGGVDGFSTFLAHDFKNDIVVVALGNFEQAAAYRVAQSLRTMLLLSEILK
jgi:hypothetical protein